MVEPNRRYRRQAGPYDQATGLPRYAVEISAPDLQAHQLVEDNSHAMGTPGQFFWVWDIRNGSRWPVFLTLTVDGESAS